MTIREAIATGSAALKAVGIETHSLDAELLLAEIFGVSRTVLMAAGPQPLAEDAHGKFLELLRQRQAGECLAYIISRKEFYGLEFAVNPAVLVPRPDTETLVEAALCQLKIVKGKLETNDGPLCVLDLCTGCGAVAIALKHEIPELDIWATDISGDALETAAANASRLLPTESIRFCRGDLFDALTSWDSHPQSHVPSSFFTLIVSNPPYIPTQEIGSLAPEVRNEPRLALDGGSDGLEIIRKIIEDAPAYLAPGGALLLEADPRQINEIGSLMKSAGFSGISVHKDLSGQDRVIGGLVVLE